MTIRKAIKADAPVILELIHELAVYEKAPNEVSAQVIDIEQTLFSNDPKVFCDVVEEDGEVVAMAIWFLNYSTWQGKHGIYLEDLYVRESARGKGYGKALLGHLAKKCVEEGYGRFQWWVLDWNEPAIEFYRAHGAVAMDEWTVFRVSGNELGELAKLS
ncbi:MAG: N-acetyltransferase family protein [Actinomycetota bacterium]